MRQVLGVLLIGGFVAAPRRIGGAARVRTVCALANSIIQKLR